jgi:methyl-accepting chemotaxis protein
VRNLAARSARAAKETADLIESTGDSAEEGTDLADNTAQALRKIVAGIGKITDLASEIAVASREQTLGSQQLPPGPDAGEENKQFPDSEESEEAAKTLAEQAQRLKELLASFKVMQKNNLAAWTELQTQAMTRKAKKQSKRLLKGPDSCRDK